MFFWPVNTLTKFPTVYDITNKKKVVAGMILQKRVHNLRLTTFTAKMDI
jgi:hypothetical protein